MEDKMKVKQSKKPYMSGDGFPDLTWSLPRITVKPSFQPTNRKR